jgi:hypothetical protein
MTGQTEMSGGGADGVRFVPMTVVRDFKPESICDQMKQLPLGVHWTCSAFEALAKRTPALPRELNIHGCHSKISI